MTVAFVPAAPLLHPEVAPDPDARTLAIRQAALEAAATLAECDAVVVLGSTGVGTRPDSAAPAGVRRWDDDAPDGLARVGLDHGVVPEGALPLSATIGRWLLDAVGEEQPDSAAALPVLITVGDDGVRGGEDVDATGASDGAEPTATSAAAAAAARAILDEVDPQGSVGLLVVGDGTATRAEKAPGHVVAGASELDDRIADLLGSADLDGLAALPRSADAAFLLDGRAVWQAAAELVARTGRVTDSRLLAYDAPHHVGYFVATWTVD